MTEKEEDELSKLKRKVSHLEDAVISTAGALVDVQFVIAELRAQLNMQETPAMKESLESLSARMDKLIERIEASVHV